MSKEVEVRWNSFTKKWYESKGYKYTKMNKTFMCKVEDLQESSIVKILVKCDYCNEETLKEYRDYIEKKKYVNKDACKKCKIIKQREVMLVKYGYDNIGKSIKQKENLNKQFKKPFNEILQICEDKGLLLLSKENDYINKKSRLRVICKKHSEFGEFETNIDNIISAKHCCVYASIESMKSIRKKDGEIVFNDFIERNFLPLFKPEDYINNNTKLPFVCNKHPNIIQKVTYISLKASNQICELCRIEKSIAKLNKRLRYFLTKWKTDSEINCNYKCILTNSLTYDIHHLYSLNNIIKDVLIELNLEVKNYYETEEFYNIKNKVVHFHNRKLGVCLDRKIHNLFHKLYSKITTEKDFEEFSIRYRLGEFNNYIL